MITLNVYENNSSQSSFLSEPQITDVNVPQKKLRDEGRQWSQTTDRNLRLVHCLASRAPTLDL